MWHGVGDNDRQTQGRAVADMHAGGKERYGMGLPDGGRLDGQTERGLSRQAGPASESQDNFQSATHGTSSGVGE